MANHDGMSRDAKPVPMRHHVPDLPAAVDAAVLKAIAIDREDRWASAKAFAAPINKVLDAVKRFTVT